MKSKILLLLLAFLAAACHIHAQATLSVQGTIQRSFGGAVDDGKYALTFKLYTAATGGTPVWSETQDNIEVIGGVYSALLGEANPLTAGFDQVYYLGIAVDGGAELIPRTRLTSAPYALSLIGQSNTFPSAGNVGVGTVSPQAKLHVNNPDGDAVQFITAPNDNNANLRLSTGNHTGYLNVNQYAYQMGSENKSINIVPGGAYGRVHLYGNGQLKAYTDEDGFVINGRLTSTSTLWTQNGDISSANGTDLRLYRNADLHILCRGDGWTEMKKALYIPGKVDQYFSQYYGINPAGFVQWISNHTVSVSAYAEGAIRAERFITPSDRRIKTDLHRSSGKQDLATLLQLEVTDYRHVDSIANGSGIVKGFIAQQVKEVFPQAVSTAKNTIPDVLAKPASMQVNGDMATFNMPAGNNIVKGDRVRIFQNGGEQKEYDVVDTQGSSFTVKGWDAAFNEVDKVFVYGKEVNDFCQVDYDKIHNLNVSATQELARRVAELEAANAGLM
ncbi:MAG: tail fiber domain-containing protein, partial [Bacteroidota bacterium]